MPKRAENKIYTPLGLRRAGFFCALLFFALPLCVLSPGFLPRDFLPRDFLSRDFLPRDFLPLPGAAFAAQAPPAPKPSAVPGYTTDDIDKLYDQIHKTGVNPGSIPAITRPAFLTVSDASLSMDDREHVFIVQYPDGTVRIYPQRIMVWHEVVNDVLPDAYTRARQLGQAGQYGDAGQLVEGRQAGDAQPAGETYTLTYSPLTGCVVAFKSLAGRYPSTFGATGALLDANTLLYDSMTGSTWSQLLAVGINGPLKGKRLERVPVLWGLWGGARKAFPNAQVLSRSTGIKRRYGQDPYGSYIEPGSYYDDTRLLFPLRHFDTRLPPKKRILGLELGDRYAAVDKDAVKLHQVMNFTVGLTPIVAFYDPLLDTVRVYERVAVPPRGQAPQPEVLTFKLFEGKYIDEQTRSEWLPDGSCARGHYGTEKLKPVLAVDAMWFAWAAFHASTEVLGLPDQQPKAKFFQ